MLDLSKRKIVVCSIVRDAENGLRANIPVLRELLAYFGDYRVVVYENDSKDRTKELLKDLQATDQEHVLVYMENKAAQKTIPMASSVNCNPFYSTTRISKMVALRNKYMEVVDQLDFNPDYLMVVDLDVAQLFLEPILNTFNYGKEWDAVTANGYSLGPNLRRRYHDSYALTEYGDEGNPQTEEKILSLAKKYGKLQKADEWIRVYSAFGGLAIYRYEAIKGLRYQLLENGDGRVEVKCEHFSIYKQMAERGSDKVFINPDMKLKYQSLSMKIVIGHLRRQWDGLVDRKLKITPPPVAGTIIFVSCCYDGNNNLKAA